MLVFGVQVHLVTFIFILLEAGMFAFQSALYFIRPQEQGRRLYLQLLLIMLFYNITGGLFPDQSLKSIPGFVQKVVAYGSDFLVASYFPFYFYKALKLKVLWWHVYYGVPLFLFLPYVIFFVIDYGIQGDLAKDLKYGLIVPFLYALELLWVLLKAVWYRHRQLQDESRYRDQLLMYLAISPWAALAFFCMVQQCRLVEVLFTNSGVIAITFIYFRRTIHLEKAQHRQLQEAVLELTSRKGDFEQLCKEYNYSRREAEIVSLLCKGLTYKGIGDQLFISENTVDNTVQKIYVKTGVNSKIELIRKLGL